MAGKLGNFCFKWLPIFFWEYGVSLPLAYVVSVNYIFPCHVWLSILLRSENPFNLFLKTFGRVYFWISSVQIVKRLWLWLE